MIKMTVYCDFCEQPMQEDENDNVQLHYTKEVNTKDIYRHLCKNCADKLDKVMLCCRKKWLDEGDKVAQIAERNAARRELLGTKG